MVSEIDQSLSERLRHFLENMFNDRVRWGVDDCSAVWAKWLAELGIKITLPDYSTREGAHAIIAQHGGADCHLGCRARRRPFRADRLALLGRYRRHRQPSAQPRGGNRMQVSGPPPLQWCI